ncbi:MAG TPA: molecular chaperone TorD family protein [Deinococcales bacterium]|nr:molecular chaperone TorD family protein [Deinococcales bacterium]
MQSIATLAAATYRSPGDALSHDIRSGTLQAVADEVALAAGLLPPALPRPSLEEIQAAYVALFVSNRNGLPAPPYAGFALDGRLLGPTCDRILREYARHGVDVSEGWPDLPDHLAAIGEAAALLCPHKPAAARRLLLDYLLPWLERFEAEVAAQDPTGLYSGITSLLKSALQEVKREVVS